jgi:predicted esterase
MVRAMTGASEARKISIPRSGRYFLQGGPLETAREVWFVLHGYGQLADGFLAELGDLGSETRMLVAPEGLSRFYLSDGSGPVGASWMTRVERQDEIDDYVRYLDAVYAAVLGSVSPHEQDVHVLGFSQGAATAMRWVALGQGRFDRLTLWAGGVPPDLDLGASRAAFERVEVTLVTGTRDALLDEARLAREEERLRAAGLPHRSVRFEGGHRLDRETLARLAGV